MDATSLSTTYTASRNECCCFPTNQDLKVSSVLAAYDAESKVATWDALMTVKGKKNPERPDGAFTATDMMDFSLGKRTAALTGMAAASRPPMVFEFNKVKD